MTWLYAPKVGVICRVTEDLHGNSGRDTLRQQQRRGRVAGVVQAGVADADAGQQLLPGSVVVARVDRRADRGREHRTSCVPEPSCEMALVQLLITVLAQRPPQRDGEWDGPPAGVALRRYENKPTRLALQRLPDPDLAEIGAVLELEVGPAQSECFALAQAQGKCHRESLSACAMDVVPY